MRITITAFDPFGGFNSNSSYKALTKLSNKDITKIVLPVSYPDAYCVLKESITECDFIILLGMAAKRTKVSIEERAKNILEFKIPDNHGQIIKNQIIDENEPEFLYSRVEIDKIIKYLNKDDELVYKSSDAGTYICNYLYFKVLQVFNTPSIFIHLPNYETDEEFDKLDILLNKLINYIMVCYLIQMIQYQRIQHIN